MQRRWNGFIAGAVTTASPGDNRKLQSGIISGVFYPAAIAVPDLLRDGRYQFFIFPARLKRWAEDNAIDWR